jgi:hypothetical protein
MTSRINQKAESSWVRIIMTGRHSLRFPQFQPTVKFLIGLRVRYSTQLDVSRNVSTSPPHRGLISAGESQERECDRECVKRCRVTKHSEQTRGRVNSLICNILPPCHSLGALLLLPQSSERCDSNQTTRRNRLQHTTQSFPWAITSCIRLLQCVVFNVVLFSTLSPSAAARQSGN